MTIRILVGGLVALCIALIARRARSLSAGGALAAVCIGTIAAAAGVEWAVLLIVYFAASTALSRLGRAEKERRTAAVVEKGGERDARQVFANGLVFTIASIGGVLQPDSLWWALGAGALAASAADTWATEIGTLYGGVPRSILTGRPLTPGTSGGVSLAGTAASIAGALFIAVVAWAGIGIGSAFPFWSVTIGGIVGSIVDSLAGATLQSRRWCADCRCETERRVHDCGATTVARHGLTWLDNDAVNFLSTLVGGLLAASLAR
jgi:uncharacterized protein (TIGR00297 family)